MMLFQVECTRITRKLLRIAFIELVGLCDSSALLLVYFFRRAIHARTG